VKGGERTLRSKDHRTGLDYLMAALRGEAVPYDDLVAAGRTVASVFVAGGQRVSVCTEGPTQGVWDLERLTDEETVAWAMWVADRINK
jgi:hypothetical protein